MTFAKNINRNQEALEKALLVVSQFNKLNIGYLQSQTVVLSKAAQSYFEYINKIQEAIKESSHKLDNVPIELSKYNWFVCNLMTIAEYNELHEFIINNDNNSIDNFMMNYINQYYKDIKKSLIKNNPSREIFINEIFKSFQKRNYVTSIPLCLIQADGLFVDAFNKKVFQSKQRENVVKEKLSDELFSAERVMYNVLGLTIPIYEFEDKHPNMLNRHRILHGIDIDYANKKYCYQSISFLKFISDIVSKTK